MKAAVPSLGVIYRLSVDDFFDGGLSYGEGRGSRSGRRRPAPTRCTSPPGITARKPTAHRMIPPMAEPDAPFLDFAADIKQRDQACR